LRARLGLRSPNGAAPAEVAARPAEALVEAEVGR
jgi:hypothetical protein